MIGGVFLDHSISIFQALDSEAAVSDCSVSDNSECCAVKSFASNDFFLIDLIDSVFSCLESFFNSLYSLSGIYSINSLILRGEDSFFIYC